MSTEAPFAPPLPRSLLIWGYFGNRNFGVINSAANPRNFQIGLKFLF
mgnify:CR=1 FL=1